MRLVFDIFYPIPGVQGLAIHTRARGLPSSFSLCCVFYHTLLVFWGEARKLLAPWLDVQHRTLPEWLYLTRKDPPYDCSG